MSGIKRFSTVLIVLLMIFPSTVVSQAAASTAFSFNVSIRVPVILKISVDQPWNTILRLSGIYGSAGMYAGQFSGQRLFEIKKASHIELGPANLFSNINGRYCILIASQNGGMLEHDAGNADRTIPYSLLVNGTPTSSSAGRFVYEAFGKSAGIGTSFDLAIELGELPGGLPDGIYSDRLVFSVMMR